MIRKINFRYIGYILTATGMLLMISFAYSEVKNFQYLSIIIAILGLILTFESRRLRAFKFSESDWVETKEDFYLEIKKNKTFKKLTYTTSFWSNKVWVSRRDGCSNSHRFR